MKLQSKTQSACMLTSISLKEVIPPDVLVGILKGHETAGKWGPYIGVFFGECPAKIMKGVMEENGLTMQDLEKCYKKLSKFYQTAHFWEIYSDVFPEYMGIPA